MTILYPSHAVFPNYSHTQHALTTSLETNFKQQKIHSCISYLCTVERTSCADSSACSHTRQALRGKETYGVFCIHFGSKIASLLLSFPSMASWKDSNDLRTACLLWHAAHTPTYPRLSAFFFNMNLISTSAVLSLIIACFCLLTALFEPKFDSG